MVFSFTLQYVQSKKDSLYKFIETEKMSKQTLLTAKPVQIHTKVTRIHGILHEHNTLHMLQ